MLLALALAGCTNLSAPQWGGGGTRYASGYAGGAYESGATDSGFSGDEGAPVIVGSTAEMAENEAGELYASITIAYEDSGDDVVGGEVQYQANVADVEQESGERQITSSPTYDPTTDAYDTGGSLQFRVGPLQDVGTYVFVVWIVDFNHNTSASEIGRAHV